MRIRETYKKFGFFCFANESESKNPGILSIKDSGYIELEVFSHSFTQYSNANKNLQHIVGIVAGQGQTTLSNCRYLSHHYRNGIHKYIFWVKKAFIGYQYKECEKNQFNTFYFSVEGLHQWIPRSWIGVQSDPITYKIDDDIHLSFQYVEDTHLEDNTHCLKEQVIRKACCKLFSKEGQSLDKFILISQKITNFLCFVMDNIVCMDEPVRIVSDKIQEELNEKKIPIYVKLYYQSRPFIKTSPQNIWPLFIFELVEHNMEQVINNWVKIYNITHPALELYFSTQTGEHRFLDAKFLTLVQSIEAYQQRILFKDLNFKKTLTELMKPFEQWISNKDVLIEKIKNTRDYFTHYNPKKENKKLYEELPTLYRKLEVIFQMTLLKALNFDNSKIKDIVLNHGKLKRNFELLSNSQLL